MAASVCGMGRGLAHLVNERSGCGTGGRQPVDTPRLQNSQLWLLGIDRAPYHNHITTTSQPISQLTSQPISQLVLLYKLTRTAGCDATKYIYEKLFLFHDAHRVRICIIKRVVIWVVM